MSVCARKSFNRIYFIEYLVQKLREYFDGRRSLKDTRNVHRTSSAKNNCENNVKDEYNRIACTHWMRPCYYRKKGRKNSRESNVLDLNY